MSEVTSAVLLRPGLALRCLMPWSSADIALSREFPDVLVLLMLLWSILELASLVAAAMASVGQLTTKASGSVVGCSMAAGCLPGGLGYPGDADGYPLARDLAK